MFHLRLPLFLMSAMARLCFCLAFITAVGYADRANALTSTITPTRQLIALSGDEWQFLGGNDENPLPDIGTAAFAVGSWTDVAVPNDFQTRSNMTCTEGWYRRSITVTPALTRKHLYLVFEGAAAIADVYVNGKLLGEHRGAYTRFVFDATSTLHVGAGNVLAVKVDVRKESTTDCLPSTNGLYTVWGGLYRNVWLLATNDLQIDPTYYASPGVFITPTLVSSGIGKVHVKVLVRNTSTSPIPAEVRVTIFDL